MKKSIYTLLLLAGSFLFNSASAQVSVSFNIGVQPVWGPVGYDYVDYYYMPDIEAYYYVPQHQFIYFDNGAWITAGALPPRFGAVDFYNMHKVVINEPRPYMHHEKYRVEYASYRGQHDQHVIRDSHDSKYFEVKEHPQHNEWKGNGGEHRQQSQPQPHQEQHQQASPQSHQPQSQRQQSQPQSHQAPAQHQQAAPQQHQAQPQHQQTQPHQQQQHAQPDNKGGGKEEHHKN